MLKQESANLNADVVKQAKDFLDQAGFTGETKKRAFKMVLVYLCMDKKQREQAIELLEEELQNRHRKE